MAIRCAARMAVLKLAQRARLPVCCGRRGPGDLARGLGLACAHDEGRDHRRPRGECGWAMGGAHRMHGRARSAGDRHGAAGHRHRARAADDQAPDRACQSAPVTEAAGERRIPGRRRLVRRLRSRRPGGRTTCVATSKATYGSVRARCRSLRGLSFVRSWTGINPAIDRAPILGEAPGKPGFSTR